MFCTDRLRIHSGPVHVRRLALGPDLPGGLLCARAVDAERHQGGDGGTPPARDGEQLAAREADPAGGGLVLKAVGDAIGDGVEFGVGKVSHTGRSRRW